MADHGNEKWFELYHHAITELEHSLMAERIADTREEIIKRVAILRDMPGLHTEEHQAIEDALQGLRFLEREDSAIEERPEVAEMLKRLAEIPPKKRGDGEV